MLLVICCMMTVSVSWTGLTWWWWRHGWGSWCGVVLVFPPLCHSLIIDSQQEVSLGRQFTLGVKRLQETGAGVLLDNAPGAVQCLHHVLHLPVGLTQLVTLLLDLGTQLTYSLLRQDNENIVNPTSKSPFPGQWQSSACSFDPWELCTSL